MTLSPALWIVLAGSLVAVSCGFVGCFLILRKMAMIGDALSHSVLPGLVVAFLITGSLGLLPMFLGAIFAGVLTTIVVQWLSRNRVQEDAAMGVTFTGLFALGVVLLSVFAGNVHLDAEHVLYGELAYVPFDTWEIGGYDLGPRAIWSLGLATVIAFLVLGKWYKEFKICAFDPVLAQTLGIPVQVFHFALMILVSLVLVASLESVGAILSVAMLIIPGATAYLLTQRLEQMLMLSVVIGIAMAISGYGLATLLDVSISGSMAVMAGIMFTIAFLFSPERGFLRRRSIG